MTVSTISTTLATQVTPGNYSYAAVLEVTQSGAIVSPGGVYVDQFVSGVSIANFGMIYGVTFDTVATLTNYGSVGAAVASVNLQNGGLVNNFGTIGAAGVSSVGVELDHATLNNYGLLSLVQVGVGVGAHGYNLVNNYGTISGSMYGVFAGNNSSLDNSGYIVSSRIAVSGRNGEDMITNSGTLAGGAVGVILNAGTLGNTGSIAGGTYGIAIAAGGAVIDGGTIAGGVDAIKASGAFVLVVNPGAQFAGAVVDSSKTGTLQLGGSLVGVSSLDLGGSFSGFRTIDFAPAAHWMLQGSIAELAAGQTIAGFAAHDTLVLDGFIASSSSVVAGVGLVLSNGFSTETLDIGGSFGAGDYTLSSTGSGTEIQHTTHVIDTEVLQPVTLGAGVYLSPLTITSTGRVASNDIGVASNAGGTLINQGMIYGGGAGGGPGVAFSNGGTVINGGEIRGSDGFVDGGLGVSLYDAQLINTGTIYGGGSGNLHVNQGAVSAYQSDVANYGVIIGGAGLEFTGGGDGVKQTGGTLFNAGTIIAGNGTYGRYGSGPIGVGVYGTGTLINAGTIIGGADSPGGETHAVDITTLVIEPGAAFFGSVQGTTLEFAAGSASNSGSLDMDGTFAGFSSIDFSADAHFLLAGNIAELAGHETINGFTVGDTLVLEGFTATSETYLIGAGLKLSNGTLTETLGITGDFSTSSFQIVDTAQGTEIVVCYLGGTRIATPDGERRVESLKIGDAVVTRFGGLQKIRWIGRQSFGRRFIAGNFERVPVRIKAGALGGGLPARDLFVSPGHSMLLGNTLVLAKALVNGVTITQDVPDADVHYYLIEFAAHDCVRAEGAWSESFADGPGLRNQFHNAGEFFSLYPAYRAPKVISLCAARPQRGERLARAIKPVAARAARMVRPGALRGSIDLAGDVIEGWAQDLAHPRLPVLLEIIRADKVIAEVLACDYRADLAAAGIGAGRAHFAFRPEQPIAAAGLLVRRKADGAAIFPSADCRLRA